MVECFVPRTWPYPSGTIQVNSVFDKVEVRFYVRVQATAMKKEHRWHKKSLFENCDDMKLRFRWRRQPCITFWGGKASRKKGEEDILNFQAEILLPLFSPSPTLTPLLEFLL